MKLLLWAGIIVAIIWILRSKKSSAKVDSTKTPQPPLASTEAMLSCAHCKIHFPASEAVFDSAHTAFCSAEHCAQHVAR